MSTVAIVRLPAAEFALGETLERVPDAEFEVERVVVPESKNAMPYVWVTAPADRAAAIENALADDPSTDDVELLVDLAGEWLYRVEWADRTQSVIYSLVEEDGTIMDAHGKAGEWRLRILFPDRDALTATHDVCETNHLRFDVEQIYPLDESHRRSKFGLTEEQHETVVTALERGYYEVPRRISGEELAEELGISHQALSERLRRAYKNLVSNALGVGDTAP